MAGHCHEVVDTIEVPEGAKRIVLAGNPNVGKSIFFNELTGVYVDVSNFPGTTLDISYGKYEGDIVIDTPGVYGVSSFNDEEIVARDVIMEADVVLNIVDAVHLERDLFLTQQIIDMGIPVVVALNMMDEAEKNGLEIDIKKLEKTLGVPVVPTIAPKGIGLNDVKEALSEARVGKTDQQLQQKIERVRGKVDSRPEALLILEDDPNVADRHGIDVPGERESIYKERRKRVNKIIDQVVTRNENKNSFKNMLGRLMVKPLTGIPILLLVLYAMYQLVGVFIAQTVVDFTEGTVFAGMYEPFIRGIVTKVISAESALGTILIGEFGVLTMTVTYTLGLLLPLVIGFYFFLSLMEDSGYLPRVATLVDRVLTKLGLNGRAVIPLILGFGCVTMATITTRLLGSKRERIIATFLLGLAIPCSAQLGVIAGLIAPLGFSALLLYTTVIFVVFIIAGTMLHAVLPGDSTDLLIDLPPLRMPRIGNVMTKTFNKARMFVEEAGPIFALGALIISVMKLQGWLVAIQNFVAPITVSWLKLPKEAAVAFIMGIVRRDFGAAGLTGLALSPEQTLVSLITITLFVPCIAAMMIIFKERNWKEAVLIWLGSWITAFTVGGLVAQVLI
ncbi:MULTISPECIES: ferrous iron transport protein B [unclassified Candidatus Frackibacter]|uniref:ferrous iron transport protein B n=1 Tax=unclassified Candidatus Frackibacter TaxID=2648818 RepID=UPI00088AB07B|nr:MULTISPECIES: ferrous iron transport protein B [unclassified Candidatus Frackibacter]SDC03828.1 ferrous iron transport protein B [Candidatus Frackibacter sp. WG11]SEM68615.1 ferrous iron transport protein B [Candidatus Frackibacter sp. WG12]SFL79901.1 ferrous iron transport protein B [Candidatus Frackibacter sp. WG13]